MDSPRAAVVIPTLDRRDLVLRTVDSVLRQRDVEVAVVVVDDGGSDGTREALESLGSADVTVIGHEHRRGVSAARNSGLALVTAPWVAFVDDDDVWAPDKLRAQLVSLAQHHPARWSCVSALHVDTGFAIRKYARAPASGDVSPLLSREPAIPGGGSGVLLDVALARDVGGFDEDLSVLADWDFYLRLSLASPVAAVDEPLLAYSVHADSMFHDPGRVLAELRQMESKYRTSDGRRNFEYDAASWAVALARMAQRLGDGREAVRILRSEARRAGLKRLAAITWSRARARAGPSREPAIRLRDERIAWLARYRDWGDGAG